MKKLLFTLTLALCSMLSALSSAYAQTIPPPYINYQAVLYDVNGANPNSPLTNQSFSTFVNINDELGNLLYREEHYASTDANGLITVKMGDGLYIAGPITNFNQINWGIGKYYLVVDFNINGTISSTAPEQLVTVPYSFYAGKAGNGMTAVADNGNGTLTFTYANGQTYITPALSGMTGAVGPAGAQGIQGIPGANGAVGATGQNGLNALIKTTSEAAGANCTNGGTKIETGLDANGNGVLETGEINAAQTNYICDGTGLGSLSSSSFDWKIPDGLVNQSIPINYTMAPSTPAYTCCSVPVGWYNNSYTVPSGYNLYISNIQFGVGYAPASLGVKVNNVLVYGSSQSTCIFNINNPWIVGENMVVSFSQNGFSSSPCNNSIYANFTGFLLPKSVQVICQGTNYTVPSGFKFIVINTCSSSCLSSLGAFLPTIYYSGQTVPAKTNGYIIPN